VASLEAVLWRAHRAAEASRDERIEKWP
jgi:hypothetical protein